MDLSCFWLQPLNNLGCSPPPSKAGPKHMHNALLILLHLATITGSLCFCMLVGWWHDTVISVAIGSGNQVTLNLASGRSVDVSDVKEFF